MGHALIAVRRWSPPGNRRLAIQFAVALIVACTLGLAWRGYRNPELFLTLVSFPLC